MKPFLLMAAILVLVCYPLEKASAQCFCISTYKPVCGTNGATYSNACLASCQQVKVACKKKCPCSKSTSKPFSIKQGKPPWKGYLPYKHPTPKKCQRNALLWAKGVTDSVAQYIHKKVFKTQGLQLKRYNGVLVGKLWHEWLQHPSRRQYQVLVYLTYRYYHRPKLQGKASINKEFFKKAIWMSYLICTKK